MTELKYHILGYNHNFGVIRIEGGNCSEKEVVVFPSQPIVSSLRLNHREILFVSKKGECARLNLETGDITQKSKTFPHYNNENTLLTQGDGQTLYSVTNRAIDLVDLPSLMIRRTLNVALTDEDGTLRLHDYDDIKGPYEAKAEKEKKELEEYAKANPEGPRLKKQWHWAAKLAWWPTNYGQKFQLNWNAKYAALQDQNILIIPFTKKEWRDESGRKTAGGLGLARIDIQNGTLQFEELDEFDTEKPPNKSIFRKISSDGKGLILDRGAMMPKASAPSKLGRLFGKKRKPVEADLEHHMEIWRIEDKVIFDRHVSLGTKQSTRRLPGPLEDKKENMVASAKEALFRRTTKSIVFDWQSIQDTIHILKGSGELRLIAPDKADSIGYFIEDLPQGVENAKLTRRCASQLFLENTLNYGGVMDGLLIDLPISPVSIEDESYIPTQRVYDKEKFVNDHKIAEKLSQKARKGYISVQSKSAASLTNGLSKLTPEYAKYFDEIILSNRWDAGLYHKKTLILEKEIAKVLTEAKDPEAIPALADFVRAVMWVSARMTSSKDDLKIEPYPRDMGSHKLSFPVWHNDDETQVGMPSVNALIALSETVPELALTFYRYRDFEHDVYTDDTGLIEDVLPHLNLEKPGMLKLLAITAFQLLATGRVKDDLFAQHGMNLLAEALESGELSPKLTAQIFVQEVKGMQGNLSWGQNLGPAGLVAQAVHGLDDTSNQIKAFGQAMFDLYPEAREFLEKKLAG